MWSHSDHLMRTDVFENKPNLLGYFIIKKVPLYFFLNSLFVEHFQIVSLKLFSIGKVLDILIWFEIKRIRRGVYANSIYRET